MDVPSGDVDLQATLASVLDRWPSAGVAVAVVRAGSPVRLLAHGVADVGRGEPVGGETVFRIGSVTKTFTAIAVMQLWEQGLVDLDAPVADHLRTVRLVPAQASFAPVTVRHLLTHTAGIGYWRRLSDLLQPGVGSGDRAGRTVPTVADYYRRGLPVEVEPGTKWVYSNHGFTVLGQLVEDVTGQPLDQYLRARIFEPLGMDHTDLARTDRVRAHAATGYVLRRRGLTAVEERELPTPGGGGMRSSPGDLARYVAALLHGGAAERGSILRPDTLAAMFQPHFQPDARLPGMGLGFEPGRERGHGIIRKTGVVSGFSSAMVMAPADGIGVVVLTNTGGLDGRGASDPLATTLLRRLLGLPDGGIRTDIPVRPDRWRELCGWYGPDPGPVTNLFARALLGAGVEVVVEDGHLTLLPLTPVPAMRRGLRLHPDDPLDPSVFRVELPDYGMCLPVVFSGNDGGGRAATRLLFDLLSFRRRPAATNPRRWVRGAAVAGASALAVGGRRAVAGRRRS